MKPTKKNTDTNQEQTKHLGMLKQKKTKLTHTTTKKETTNEIQIKKAKKRKLPKTKCINIIIQKRKNVNDKKNMNNEIPNEKYNNTTNKHNNSNTNN